tara:strand:+ start:355 stop:549 length:195 start_codon:yes stop_codon:yes gene_type:complete
MDIKVGDKVQVNYTDPFLEKVLGKPVGIVKVFNDNENTFGVSITDSSGEETLFWYPPAQLTIFV